MSDEVIKELTEAQEKVKKAKEVLQKEFDVLQAKWDKTRLLVQIEDDYARGVMAVCLENQRLINESMVDSGDIAQFKRVSIPLVRRVYDPRSFVAWDLVGVQPLLGPRGYVFANRPTEEYSEEVGAFTKKLKVVFPTPLGLALESDFEPTRMEIRKQYSLDEEAAMLAQVAIEICEEFSREVITDLRNNVATKGGSEWRTSEELWTNLDELFGTVRVKCGEFPNWIVAHPDMAKVLKEGGSFAERQDKRFMEMSVSRTGTLTRHGRELKVVEDDKFPRGEVLFGHKGNNHVTGYVYLPYVPFTRTPVVLDPETFAPRVGVLTRYGKKLVEGGAKFYGRIVVNNFPEPEKAAEEA
jgi:hypothetical protein